MARRKGTDYPDLEALIFMAELIAEGGANNPWDAAHQVMETWLTVKGGAHNPDSARHRLRRKYRREKARLERYAQQQARGLKIRPRDGLAVRKREPFPNSHFHPVTLRSRGGLTSMDPTLSRIAEKFHQSLAEDEARQNKLDRLVADDVELQRLMAGRMDPGELALHLPEILDRLARRWIEQ